MAGFPGGLRLAVGEPMKPPRIATRRFWFVPPAEFFAYFSGFVVSIPEHIK